MDMLTCFGKKLNFILLLSLPLTLHAVQARNKPELIDVKIGVMESLSPTAPGSSERYKRFLEAAIYYAAGENEAKLSKCGYKLTPSISYFDTYDIQELIHTTKELEAQNAWAIIGPRRSGHFLTAAKNLEHTPIISTMANADEIYSLNKLTFSMYPSASQLAQKLSKQISSYGQTYASVVDVRCTPCVNFSNTFTKSYKGTQAFEYEVASNTPNLKPLLAKLKKQQVDFLVIPNYSELTGYVISEVHKKYPNIKFIGSDGWGEDTFSLMQGYGINKEVKGIAIRSGVQKQDKNQHYRIYSLEREINGETVTPPNSIYAIVESIRTISDDLCESKAKDQKQFTTYMTTQPQSHFQKRAIYSLYELKDSKLTFLNYV